MTLSVVVLTLEATCQIRTSQQEEFQFFRRWREEQLVARTSEALVEILSEYA
jgi:hypothetical protein